MIDANTGTVVLDGLHKITGALTLSSFQVSSLGQGAQSIGVATDWPRFFVGKHEIFGDACTVILMFHKQQLIGVRVHVLDPSLVDPKPDFDDYDVGAALALKLRFEAWLAAKLGPPPYLYPWGRIDAVYSPQDVSTGIFVSYTTAVHSSRPKDR